MQRTYGAFTADKPAGMLRAVRFPQLMLTDVETGDGRLFESAGGGVRELPRTIKAMFADDRGHLGSVPIGRLDEITFSDDEPPSGRGWLIDLPHVRDTFVPLMVTKTMFHNSVDLAEIVVELQWKSDDPASPDFWEYTLNFSEWNIAATTILAVPAFQDARALLDDEVTAALLTGDSELEMNFGEFTYHLEGVDDEITAADAPTVPWADFHVPAPPELQSVRVDGEGRVSFHLAAWEDCHGGFEDRCVLAPRVSSYASFNASSVLTDRGPVETGPVFFLGGHPDKPLTVAEAHKAYGGVENAWCDVRVTDSALGPWACGRVRPGLAVNSLYAARASRVSGHWKGGQLRAIVSVNVPGYNVPGSKLSYDHDGAVIHDGEIVELVASLRAVPAPAPTPVGTTIGSIATAGTVVNISYATTSDSAETLAADPNIAAAVAARQALAAELAAGTAAPDDTTEDDDADLLAELDLADLELAEAELPMADATSNDS